MQTLNPVPPRGTTSLCQLMAESWASAYWNACVSTLPARQGEMITPALREGIRDSASS